MSDASPPIQIDIVSDVVCPWCIIGYSQLNRAADDAGIALSVRWHPFELNPDMPPEGENLREHVARKYCTTPDGSRKARARLTAIGAELGFDFVYGDDMRMVNTFQAHQLLTWAAEHGRQHELKMALFAAFFSKGEDVSDVEILVRASASVGLDVAEARAVLSEDRFAAVVRQEQRVWLERGITGVPAMIFQGRYLLSGAQGVETYSEVLNQVVTAPAA